MSERGPLGGIRVADFTHVVAGPHCTALLADAGADVIKIEPPGGDETRNRGPVRNGDAGSVGAWAAALHGGKRCVVLDLKDPAARSVARRIIATCDVLVENFAPGVMGRLGLDLAELRMRHPGLVTASISLLGGAHHLGPVRTGMAIVAEAESGIASRIRNEDGRPLPLGTPLGDTVAGVVAYAGIVTALLERHTTGAGGHVDVSMVGSLLSCNGPSIASASIAGSVADVVTAPYGYFPTEDGWVAIGVARDHLWRRLTEVMGDEALAADARFALVDARRLHRDQVEEVVRAWTCTRTTAAIVDALSQAGVPCGPLNTPVDILANPEYRALGLLDDVDDGLGGLVTVPANPLGFARAQGGVRAPGTDTADVIGELKAGETSGAT